MNIFFKTYISCKYKNIPSQLNITMYLQKRYKCYFEVDLYLHDCCSVCTLCTNLLQGAPVIYMYIHVRVTMPDGNVP